MKKSFMFLIALIFVIGLVKCKGSSEDSTTTSGDDVTLRGTLSSTTKKRGVQTRAVQYELYKLYCVTFEESPSAASGDADSTGYFELTLAGAKDTPFGCFVQSKATSAVVATLVFQDSSGTSLGGGDQKQGQISLSGSANLGTITLDLDKGIATVDMANVTTTTDVSNLSDTDLFDFSGTWNMGPFSGTLPSGYENMSECSAQGGDGPCYDPTLGYMPIYLLRVPATETASGESVYGIMVWARQEAFQACGDGTVGALGFNNGDIAGVDFSPAINAGIVKDGDFTWSADVKNQDGFVIDNLSNDTISGSGLPWLLDKASLQWDMGENSGQEAFLDGYTSFTDNDGNGIYDEGTDTLGTKDTTLVNGWYDGPEWFDDGNGGTLNGVQDGTEAYDDMNGNGQWDSGEVFYDGYTFTDTNGNGAYDPGTDTLGTKDTTLVNGWYDWGTWTTVANAGDLCSTLSTTTDKEKLDALRCYADAYWMTLGDPMLQGCFPDMRFNWDATTPADFVNATGKARAMYVFEKFIYTGANSGSFTDIQEYENGFEYMRSDDFGGGSDYLVWARCNIIEKLEMNVTKISDTKMIGDMKMTKTLDTSANNDPICSQVGEPFVDKDGDKAYSTGDTLWDQNGNGTYDATWTAAEQLNLGVSRVMVEFTKAAK